MIGDTAHIAAARKLSRKPHNGIGRPSLYT